MGLDVMNRTYMATIAKATFNDVKFVCKASIIYGDAWEGSDAYIGAFKILLEKENILNRNQCANLCESIEHVTKVFDNLMTCTNVGLEFGLLLSDFFFILNQSYLLVKNCGKLKWCEEAIH